MDPGRRKRKRSFVRLRAGLPCGGAAAPRRTCMSIPGQASDRMEIPPLSGLSGPTDPQEGGMTSTPTTLDDAVKAGDAVCSNRPA